MDLETSKKYLIIILSVVLLDQFLKNLLPFKVKNYGASFNLLQNYPALLIITSILALIIFTYFFVQFKEDKLAITFLIAGTLSNLIDRIFLGYIVDYINLPNLFTFNLADLANTIGVILLIIKLWK